MEYPMKVYILGTEYTIEKRTQEDKELAGLGGYCKNITPLIVIGDLSTYEGFDSDDSITIENIEKNTLRHEIIHAFLNESGLGDNAFATYSIPWSKNEEMVDWFAIQSPKIFKVYEEVGCL